MLGPKENLLDLSYVVFKSCKLGLSVGTSMDKEKTWGCDVKSKMFELSI